MTAIPNHFDDFLENIRLDRDLRDACRDAHRTLRKKLLADADLSPRFVSMFLQGSYARHTGTKPFGQDTHVDVDLVVVTDFDANTWSPDDVVRRFEPFLDREYPNEEGQPKQWERNDRSIKISPTGSPVTLDLVITAAPSEAQQEFLESFRESDLPELDFEVRREPESRPIRLREAEQRIAKAFGGAGWQSEPLLIPDRLLQRWVPTHPLEQIRRTAEKNSASGGHFVNVVKAIRWWRKQNAVGEYPKSYPLEHFVWTMCPDVLETVADGVTAVFERIATTQQPWQFARGVPYLPDHGVPQNDVFRKITPEQYRIFHALVVPAASKAREALNAATVFDSATAWQELFGPEFPPPPPASGPFEPPSGRPTMTRGRYG